MIRRFITLICSAAAVSLIGFSLAMPSPAQAQHAACSPVRTADSVGETVVRSLEHDGMTRFYRLYVPERYDPAVPSALVFSLHGFASNPAQQEDFSRWNEIADAEGFVVAYPQGTGFPLRWASGSFGRGTIFSQADDVGFLRALVSEISAALCIDSARVYVNGLSNGGGMSYRLGCEAADVFAAIGTVAGAYGTITCNPVRPVPVITFHGTDDQIVPIEGNADLPSIADWVNEWAERNACPDFPEDLKPAGSVFGIRYTNCADGSEVVFYIVGGGGHTWPGGRERASFITGTWNQDISASALMWDFFAAHPMPEGDA